VAKKTDRAQSDEAQNQAQSQTEIHVETHSEQHISSGGVSSDDQSTREDELTADLQRIQAEFVNYKRRAEAERSDVISFAKSRVVREFLAVRDTFDQEQAHRPPDADPQWAASIDAIRNQFDAVLKNLGVERFESVGQPFDPHLHEAVSSDGDGDTVVGELQAGYKLGDTVLRHAMVKVGNE
jgi:molecular chaperone GrpE